MKDCNHLTGPNSNKKANGRTKEKPSSRSSKLSLLSSSSQSSPSRAKSSEKERKRIKQRRDVQRRTKKIMGAGSSSTNGNGSRSSSAGRTKAKSAPSSTAKRGASKNGKSSAIGGGDSNHGSPNKRKKKKAKQSPELRPRRRASQTYFFKYQLARNPLKAEEEDLKMALLASLQQCANAKAPKSTKSSSNTSNHMHNNNNNNNNNINNNNNNNSNLGTSSNSNSSANHCKKLTASSTTNTNMNATTSKTNTTTTTSSSSYTVQPIESPDEDALKKYKPETEDFLTFICFRHTSINNRITDKQSPSSPSNDSAEPLNNLKLSSASTTSSPIKLTNTHSNNSTSYNNNSNHINTYSPTANSNHNHNDHNHDQLSPNYHRRPTRQSPRLASSNRKISENDSTSNTAYDNSITYEEDMKRASIALEDMAQEINSSDGMNNRIAQNAPFKDNKHLVKGLMTREFAGAFADEQTIFESISNHKL